ncbi:hypothetical protein EDB84DRAFT_1441746 [Lactarius hengduanensis]|nr:hypothetical protein EDB84DRAFT_1441746 [Lactarius hengduanensis]
MSVTALVRRPEAVERVSALGPHVCVVEGSFTNAHGLELVERHTRAADDVVNAACSDDLALHSAILAGQRKRMPGKLCENNCWRISGIVAWVNQYSSILGLRTLVCKSDGWSGMREAVEILVDDVTHEGWGGFDNPE